MSHDAASRGEQPSDLSDEEYHEPADPWSATGGPIVPWPAASTEQFPADADGYPAVGVGHPWLGAGQGSPSQSTAGPHPTPPTGGAAPPRRSAAGLVLLACLVAALAGLGGVVGLYLLGDRSPGTAPGANPTIAARYPTEATVEPTASATSSVDARAAGKGDCLVNDGTEKRPVMRVAKCGKGAFQVLARFDGTKDFRGKCNGKVNGYQFYYFFDTEPDSDDFVLCLRRR
ncbi:LppU/SCO3897 family protein [Pilimelia columellifera]|uniref:Serine/threonine protein kinase n=1 Tax=Pilimelia columellifera subsp. columellifera TaxID=706583 RepID=A0ABN3MZU2_9ACTN